MVSYAEQPHMSSLGICRHALISQGEHTFPMALCSTNEVAKCICKALIVMMELVNLLIKPPASVFHFSSMPTASAERCGVLRRS